MPNICKTRADICKEWCATDFPQIQIQFLGESTHSKHHNEMDELLHYSNLVINFTSTNYDSFIFDPVRQNTQLPVFVSTTLAQNNSKSVKKKFSKMQPSSLSAGKHIPVLWRLSTALLFLTANYSPPAPPPTEQPKRCQCCMFTIVLQKNVEGKGKNPISWGFFIKNLMWLSVFQWPLIIRYFKFYLWFPSH